MAIIKVTFPDGTSFSNQGPDDVTDPEEVGLADGGHDPGMLDLITKLLVHLNTTVQTIGGLGASVAYNFDDATADEDPGAGALRLNGAANAATEMFADLESADGIDVTALLDALDDAGNPTKGFVALRQADDNTRWAIYRLTGVTVTAGYRKLAVTPLVASSATPFAAGAALQFSFSQAGDQGAPGDDGAPGADGGGMASVVEDATPQLGGDLDVNGRGLVSTGDGDIPITPDGTGRTTIKNPTTSGTTTLGGAVEGAYDNVGDVTGAAAVTAAPYSRVRLTGDTTITLADPTADTLAVPRGLEVVQDGTGGWVPTFTGFTAIGDMPDWAAQDPDAVTVLGWYVTPTGRKRIYVIEEPEA